jgi:hypothetical protein
MTDRRPAFGAAIALLSALWGLGAAITFAFRMLAMHAGVGGFLFLGLHVVPLLTLVAFGYFKTRASAPNNYWSLLFIGSIVFLALSLIPGSTIGSIMLPAAIGMLLATLLLRD